MVRNLKSVGVLLFFAALIAGCSKSSSTGSATKPELKTQTFAGPTTTSDSLGALLAQGYAGGINLDEALFTSYMVGSGTQNGNSWAWTDKSLDGKLTITWSGTTQGDGSYSWSLVFNGTTDTATYNNWTALKGSTSADGKTGNWTVYNTNSTKPAVQFTWSTGSDGTLTGDVKEFETDGTTQIAEIKVIDHSDKSGEVDFYTGTALTFKATWIANGSGQWTMWNDTGATVISSGTWS